MKEYRLKTFELQDARWYFQFKVTESTHNGQLNSMVQIIDVSDTILYERERGHTDMLQVVNATVSHELRNPLNSLIAQNIEKKALYKQLEFLINKVIKEPYLLNRFQKIMDKLQYGNKVQEQSASVMRFLIQDLLDYSQIKAGKFRKNV